MIQQRKVKSSLFSLQALNPKLIWRYYVQYAPPNSWIWRAWIGLSKLYFFLPSVTDRAEEISKYLNDVSLLPIDITQGDFKQWLPDQNFEPHYLDLYGENKKIMLEYVVKALKHVAQISNANIVRNPDGLFSFVKRRCLLIGLVNQKFVYLLKSIRPVINF